MDYFELSTPPSPRQHSAHKREARERDADMLEGKEPTVTGGIGGFQKSVVKEQTKFPLLRGRAAVFFCAHFLW
jgi:hypothetical protein